MLTFGWPQGFSMYGGVRFMKILKIIFITLAVIGWIDIILAGITNCRFNFIRWALTLIFGTT